MNKSKIMIIIFGCIVLLLNAEDLFTQTVPQICDGPLYGSGSSFFAHQGRYRTSKTYGDQFFRVLVLFVRFADDTVEAGSNWPDPNSLPYWAAHIVDNSTASIGSTDPRNMSVYFNENSYGKYKLIGDVYYVPLLHDENYYHSLPGSDITIRGTIIREALETLNNTPYNVDFKRYDNWSTSSDYWHIFQLDGNIDMIWFLTRSYHSIDTKFSRTAADLNIINSPLVLDNVNISNTFDEMKHLESSGITLIRDIKNEPVYIYKPDNPNITVNGQPSIQGILAHEMTHYFFGNGHFGDGSIALSGSTNRRAGFFDAYAANNGNCFGHFLGYEKFRLGWIDDTDIELINSNQDQVYSYDMATTNDPSKKKLIEIDIPGTDQYFLIENRQFISSFETRYAPFNQSQATLTEGLLIYHMIAENEDLNSTSAQIRSADGKFNWVLSYDGGGLSNDGNNLRHNADIINKSNSNRVNGYDERELIKVSGAQGDWYYAGYWPMYGNPEGGGPYPECTNYLNRNTAANDNIGDRLDLFHVGDVFTPWSNPPSHYWNNGSFAQTTIGVEVVDYLSNNDGTYVLNIRVTNPEELNPSKPQDLTFSADIPNCQINLSWTLNEEPDITGTDGNGYGLYKIYSSSDDGNNYIYRGSVQHPIHSYQDDYSTLNIGVSTLYYKLKSVDNTNKESNYSDLAKFVVAKGTITSNVTTQDKTVYVLGDVTVASGVTWEVTGNSILQFCPGADIYVEGTLILQKVKLSEENNFVCRAGGRIIFPDEAIVEGLKTMSIENGGTLEVRNGCNIMMSTFGEITIRGAMISNQGTNSVFSNYLPFSLWNGIVFDHTSNLSASSVLNLTITNAINGITTNYSQPLISNCTISNNANAGLNIIGDSPFLINNHCDNNAFGLIGYQMNTDVLSNCFCGNFMNGALLLNCGNVWYNNKADYNFVGVVEVQGSCVDYNRNGNQNLGNGMRHNSQYGLEAWDNSDPDLAGWNSVYANTMCDLVAHGNSIISGNNNAMPYSCVIGKVYWTNPISVDYVETCFSGGSHINFTNWTDQQLFDYAHSKKYSGEYSTAVDALKELHGRGINRALSVQGAKLWYKILLDAWFNAPNNDYISQNIESAKDEFHNRITNNLPLNSVPGRRLYHISTQLKSYSKQFDSSITMLDQLIIHSPATDEKQCYMLDKLLAELHGKGNRANALSVFQQLSSLDSTTKYYVEAKLILGLPFTIPEWKAAFGYNSAHPEPIISNIVESNPEPEGFTLSQNNPNPFSSSTNISYELRKSYHVRLTIFNLLGREVKRLVDEFQNNGSYTTTLSGIGLNNGLYFYRLEVDGKVKIRKMCLVK